MNATVAGKEASLGEAAADEPTTANPVSLGILVPGLPHPLLCPEKNEGWQRVRDGFATAREQIAASGADLLVVYSTMWPSILGHQFQANPEPEWTHVDDDFHYLGSIPYKFRIDAKFAELAVTKAKARGLHARTVAYHGFPIDTGTVVALKLLNPDNELPAAIVSSNIYANRTETTVLGKALRDAVEEQGRTAVAVVVSTLSNRLVTEPMEPADDHIHSLKDDEWNRKFLEYLEKGRLEDLSQLSRQFHDEARVPKVVAFKPFWWWAAFMGQANLYSGTVHAYEPVWGTGSAVVSLEPAGESTGDLEYDEDDPGCYSGDREVLDLHDAPSMGSLPGGNED